MSYIFLLFPWFCIAGALMQLGLIIYCLPRWRQHCVSTFIVWVTMTTLYTLFSGLSSLLDNLVIAEGLLIYGRFTILALLPIWGLRFAVEYTGRHRSSRNWIYGLLIVIPLLTIILLFAYPAGRLLIERVDPVSISGHTYWMNTVLGPWFPFHAAYSYLLVVGMIAVFFVNLLEVDNRHLAPGFLMFFGTALPAAGSALSLTLSGPLSCLHWDVIFGIFGVPLLASALLQYRIFELVPVARTAIFSGMQDAVFVVDSRGQLLDSNRAAETLCSTLALPPFTTSNRVRSIASLLEAFPELGGSLCNLSGEASQSLSLSYAGYTFAVTLSPVPYGVGRHEVKSITFRDTSNQQRLISELDAFAHTVAHDLKNPLGGVQGYAQLVMMALKDGNAEEAENFAKEVCNMTQRMDRIIYEILTLARLRATEEAPVGAFCPTVAAEESMAMLVVLQQKHEAEVNIAKDMPSVIGHEPWIVEVFSNFISNAIKYGAACPRVVVYAEHVDDKMIRLCVNDNGAGLDASDAEKLFQEFVQVGNKASANSHGLGLSIVKRIAEKLQGEVGVIPKGGPEGGAVFWIELPAATSEYSDDREDLPPGTSQSISPDILLSRNTRALV